ncbi:hypothetical protein D9615_009739 [Tricholomella constricta]|uniref:Methylosome subunit pICln n=1 Tax=Tricholomella constricta TaxID=117010 RepID=A0A8H5GSS1_9AGAR|nr:hypothetical protein D9615_009739 [Tricholomella constricta]
MPAVTLITALPTFASPEEHRQIISSTPASFSSIPPVCKHQELNVTVRLDPAVDGFTDQDAAQGTLYVLTSVLVFMSSTGRGFQIEYPAITLHAISRGENGPSIYCQLDESDPSAPGADDDEEDTELRELSILPQQNGAAALEPIFEALSMCAALHPDKNNDGEGLDGDDDAFIDASNFDTFTGDEAQELSEVGRTNAAPSSFLHACFLPCFLDVCFRYRHSLQAALAHLESIIDYPHDLTSQANGIDGSEDEDDREEEEEEEEEKQADAEEAQPAVTTANRWTAQCLQSETNVCTYV